MNGMDMPPLSVREHLERLRPNETYSRVIRVPIESASRDRLLSEAYKMRNNLNKQAERATMRQSGVRYQIETGEVVVREAVLVVLAVTRVE